MDSSNATPPSKQDSLERLPVIGPWLADSFDAWLGIADALNLGGLRTVLLADPEDSSSRITHADPSSPSSTSGQWVDARQAAPSSPLSDRAA
ncbi:MAG: hypothetical protein JJT88_14675 [Gammaproteobacteria bacterium]|nr:hypothetical protein [Gammaproteobacteria bacterium]